VVNLDTVRFTGADSLRQSGTFRARRHRKVPNPVNMPNYCYFKDRCEMCVEGCEGAYPGMYQISPTHFVSCYRCAAEAVGKEGDTKNEQ